MVNVYLLTNEELKDRSFDDIDVMDLQLEGRKLTLEEFQQLYNSGKLDSRSEFIKFVSV